MAKRKNAGDRVGTRDRPMTRRKRNYWVETGKLVASGGYPDALNDPYPERPTATRDVDKLAVKELRLHVKNGNALGVIDVIIREKFQQPANVKRWPLVRDAVKHVTAEDRRYTADIYLDTLQKPGELAYFIRGLSRKDPTKARGQDAKRYVRTRPWPEGVTVDTRSKSILVARLRNEYGLTVSKSDVDALIEAPGHLFIVNIKYRGDHGGDQSDIAKLTMRLLDDIDAGEVRKGVDIHPVVCYDGYLQFKDSANDPKLRENRFVFSVLYLFDYVMDVIAVGQS